MEKITHLANTILLILLGIIGYLVSEKLSSINTELGEIKSSIVTISSRMNEYNTRLSHIEGAEQERLRQK